MADGDVVLQPRCIFCKLEHYVLNVLVVSHARGGCHNCGRTPPVFTDEAAYREALRDEDWRAVQ